MKWKLNPELVKLRAQIDKAYPNRDTSWDGWIGDTAHSAKKSDHNPDENGIVNAIDITHDPENGCDAGKIAEALRLSKDPRLKYCIWNRRIFSSVVRPWVWRVYKGENPHDHHVHVSVGGDAVPWKIY